MYICISYIDICMQKDVIFVGRAMMPSLGNTLAHPYLNIRIPWTEAHISSQRQCREVEDPSLDSPGFMQICMYIYIYIHIHPYLYIYIYMYVLCTHTSAPTDLIKTSRGASKMGYGQYFWSVERTKLLYKDCSMH